MIAAQLAERRRAEQAASAAADAAAAAATAALTDPIAAGPSDKLFYDKLMEARSGTGPETEQEIGTCAICGLAMAARRQVKTLPCGHVFHFACIDTYHRDKLNKDKCVDMPCYTCGAATNKSIASVAAEMRKKREAAMILAKAELAANPALAADLAAEIAGSVGPVKNGLDTSVALEVVRCPDSQGVTRIHNKLDSQGPSVGAPELNSQEAPRLRHGSHPELQPIGDEAPKRQGRNGSQEPLRNLPDSTTGEAPMIGGAAKRSTSRRRTGGALAALARAANSDDTQP